MPTIPGWIPPVTPAADLNQQRDLNETLATVIAEGEPLPLIVGEQQVGGKIFAVHYDSGTWTVGVAWCVGECDSIVAVYLNGEEPDSNVDVNHYLGTTSQGVDPLLAAAIGSTYEDDLVITRPGGSIGVCYSVFQYTDGDYSTFPNFVAQIKGLKTDGGAWSDNPAHALGFLIEHPVLGPNLTADDTTLAVVESDCDDTVITEKRRTIGLVIDEPMPYPEWIRILQQYAGCWAYRRGDTYYFQSDRPLASESHIPHYTTDDWDSFHLLINDRDRIPTVVELVYTSTVETIWRERTVTKQLDGVSAGTVPRRVSRVKMPGVVRYSQAARECLERLNKLQRFLGIAFDGFDDAIGHEPGDVISATRGSHLVDKQFRIVSAPRKTLGGPVVIQGVAYSEDDYVDTEEEDPFVGDTEQVIGPGVGSGITISTIPSGPKSWVRAPNDGAWSPVSTTVDITFTFFRGGVEVAEHVVRFTRDSSGLITIATQGTPTGEATTLTKLGDGTSAATATVTHDDSSVGRAETVIAVQGGLDGSASAAPRTITGLVYYQNTSEEQPAAPTATAFDFDSGEFTDLSEDWAESPPTFAAGNTNKYWYAYFIVAEDEFGSLSAQTITFATVKQGIGFSGLVTFQGDADTISDGTNTMSFGASGTTQINGGQIIAETLQAQALTIGSRADLARGNLIANPGAETDSFHPHTTVPSGGTWSILTSNPRSGARCFGYSSAGQSGSAAIIFNGAGTDGARVFAAVEGDKFRASAWVRGQGTAPFNQVALRLRWVQADGTLITTTSQTITPTGPYQKLEVAGEAPAGTAFFRLDALVLNEGGNGCRIDDVELRNAGALADLNALPINLLLGGTFADFIEIGQGGKIYSGKSSWDAAAAGWIIELSAGGVARMRFGNADNTKSLTWNGTDLIINGALVVNSSINHRLAATMERGSKGSSTGFTLDVVFGPHGSLSPRFFSFGGVQFEIISLRTSSGNLVFRLEGGSQAQRAAAWGEIDCSIGTFTRASATETNNGTYSDYTWTSAGTFASTGVETVTINP